MLAMAFMGFQRHLQQGLVHRFAGTRVDVHLAIGQCLRGPFAQRFGPAAGGACRTLRAQVGRKDLVARGNHGQAAAQVFQLSHVAWEVALRDGFQCGLRKALGRQAQFLRGAGQEVLGQQRDVAAALAQRRQFDAHHVQAMLEVGAKLPPPATRASRS